ncbi:MAG: hypothetical protein FWF15_04475 [Oscillospiraceae bacterium]|nr:hypothetical protein [Oscillospiraceae bacterium]
MAGTTLHLAIADKIYDKLGDNVIKNLPLFFGGNLAPDAIHAKKDYQREDKKHSHLCDGIRSYGYGYPEVSKLFKDRVNEFIENYYLPAGDDKELYLGYAVHLLADEYYLLAVYERLDEHLKSKGINIDAKTLADEVNNHVHSKFFSETSYILDISPNEYDFKQNVVDVLEAVWDYEVKDYITAEEINISKRWIIDNFFKNDQTKETIDRELTLKFIDGAANNIIEQLNDVIR